MASLLPKIQLGMFEVGSKSDNRSAEMFVTNILTWFWKHARMKICVCL